MFQFGSDSPAGSYVAGTLVAIWAIFWKGVALWRSAHDKQRNWFIAILILNSITVGILEMVYLFKFAKRRLTVEELKSWLPKRVPKHAK